MGDIGPAQQRFEVLPIPTLTPADVRERPKTDLIFERDELREPFPRADSPSQP